MKLYKNKEEQLPTIIADLSGKILYINDIARQELFPANVGDSILKFISPDHIRKSSMLGVMDIVAPENCNYERAIVKAVGQGITKTLEATFFHSTRENIENDKRLFSSYNEISKSEASRPVLLNELVEQIIENIKKDLRFSYKDFVVVKTENLDSLYANFTRLCTLVIGTIVVFNEIDYKADIRIGIRKINDDYVLTISLCKVMFDIIDGPRKLSKLYPHVASRIEYLNTLCSDSNIEYKLSSKPDGIYFDFVVTNSVNETGKFAQSPVFTTLADFVAYVMGLFVYDDINDITEEEQE